MDLNKIVSGLVSSGVLGGALGGALVSNKKARKTAGTLLKVGGVAALGTIAWKAYQGYQSNRQPGTPVASEVTKTTYGQDPAWRNIPQQQFQIAAEVTPEDSKAVLLIQAMIAAACADGHLDVVERKNILARVDEMGLAADEKALVFDALQSPPSLIEIAAGVDSPELAVEVYASSLVVVDLSRRESGLYLDALAFRLGLPEQLVKQLHLELETPAEQQAA